MNLLLCCNDHRNGMFQGFIEDASVELAFGESCELDGSRISVRVDGNILHLGRIKLRLLGYTDWVGTWCWNLARLDSGECLRALNYLKKRGWTCSCGPTQFYDRWKEPGPITPEEWPALVNLEDSK